VNFRFRLARQFGPRRPVLCRWMLRPAYYMYRTGVDLRRSKIGVHVLYSSTKEIYACMA
jgi:hypothetical protein